MARWLKTSISAADKADADTKVRGDRRRPAGRYRQARRRGGAGAVGQIRQLGPRRLPADAMPRSRAAWPSSAGADLEDITLRPGAGPQLRPAPARGAARHRGRDAARRRPRPQEHPGRARRAATCRAASTRCWPRPTCRSSPPRSRACPRVVTCAPPYRGQAGAGDRRGAAPGGRRRDLLPRRRPGGRRDGPGHAERSPRSTCWSAPATPSWPRPSGSSSAGSASTSSPARPRPWSSPTRRVDGELCATDLLGQAEHGPNSPGHPADDLARSWRARRWPRSSGCSAILPTADVARQAWDDYGAVIVCDSDEEMVRDRRPRSPRSTCRS